MGNAYGIDIGTSNFKMCCSDKDKILNEKNIIAIANKTELLAFGDEAYEMYEKAPAAPNAIIIPASMAFIKSLYAGQSTLATQPST